MTISTKTAYQQLMNPSPTSIEHVATPASFLRSPFATRLHTLSNVPGASGKHVLVEIIRYRLVLQICKVVVRGNQKKKPKKSLSPMKCPVGGAGLIDLLMERADVLFQPFMIADRPLHVFSHAE
jgi:hypothetical protein